MEAVIIHEKLSHTYPALVKIFFFSCIKLTTSYAFSLKEENLQKAVSSSTCTEY